MLTQKPVCVTWRRWWCIMADLNPYFTRLTQDLRELNWPDLERVAREEFDIEPHDYEEREDIVQACVSQEQYAAFS